MFASNVQFGYPCPRGGGGGASCPGWFILPPAQDLGKTVSSVNSYCTKILEYLVVLDINIISVQLKCLHPMFSLVILVWGVGGKLSRLVYLAPPRPGFGSGSVISQLLLHHYLGIFSCKRYKHYFSQTNVYIQRSVWLLLSEEWWASCPGWFILPPTQDLGQAVSSVNSYCSIILEYLVVRNINFISVKLKCLHAMFSLVILVRGVGGGGGGQADQAGLSCPPPRIWVKQCHQLILIAP